MQASRTSNWKPELNRTSVTEEDITKLLNLRESKAFLKKRLDQIDSDLDALEEELIGRIENGAVIECRYPVSVKTTERRYPSWKDAFVKVAGEQEAKKVTDCTEPTVSKSVVVSQK